IGALLATDHLHIPRRRGHPPPNDKPPPKLAVWVQRVLHEPRYGLAVLIGAAIGTPGASYLTALHHLINTKTATAVAVVAVIVFVLINWALVLVPFAFLEFRPRGTERRSSGSWTGSPATNGRSPLASPCSPADTW